MLNVQTYLRDGKTHDDLRRELGIRTVEHETLPLAILNYDQLESPKIHPVVRECRGLVLHRQTHDLVARAFPRFFNWGEVQDEMRQFDFSEFQVHTKEDGSLVLLYHFAGRWRANTRGSFGLEKMAFCDFTWQQLFARALGVDTIADLDGRLDPSLCYVCELCSPYNKVVRRYPEPVMYLLTAFRAQAELPARQVDALAGSLFRRPARYDFTSIEQIQSFLKAQTEADPTFEGVVLCDRNGQRWKIKSPTYLGLHRLKGEGGNLFHPKHLLPFVLAGEEDELLTYYPEVKDVFAEVKTKVQAAYGQMQQVWETSWRIPNQKDFAQAILGKTPFTNLLFQLRKQHGGEQTPELLRQAWRDAGDTILHRLFK
jgi:hypothetical protein